MANLYSKKARSDKAPTLPALKGGVKVIKVKFGDWHSPDRLTEILREKGLLAEDYFYSAASGNDISNLKKHGTYRINESTKKPEEHIYCCQAYVNLNDNKQRDIKILQISQNKDKESNDLYTYLTQNADEEGGVIVVWKRSKLESAAADPKAASSAAFKFKDPKAAREAIEAVIHLTDYSL